MSEVKYCLDLIRRWNFLDINPTLEDETEMGEIDSELDSIRAEDPKVYFCAVAFWRAEVDRELEEELG